MLPVIASDNGESIMTMPGLMECRASDYAESHDRKLGRANRYQLICIKMCVEIVKVGY